MRPCYAFAAAKAAGEPETLSIYDEIGFWGVQAKDFRTSLAGVQSSVINVEINSPGGDVFAGVAIYNMLKNSGKEIVVKVMGVAASAASLIAMAGDKIQMPKNTMMMIHNPWSIAMGNADELREHADTLDKIGNSLLGTYMAKTGMAEDEMKAILAKDTWLTADEALAMGFATEVTDEIKVKAAFDLKRADLPANVQLALGLNVKAQAGDDEDEAAKAAREEAERVEAERIEAERIEAERKAAEGTDEPLAQQITKVVEASAFASYAPTWAVACTSVDEAKQRIVNAREITAICAVAKVPDEAAALIGANKSVAEARASLLEMMANADKNVDTTPKSKQTQPTSKNAKPPVSTASVWASHNSQKVKKGS